MRAIYLISAGIEEHPGNIEDNNLKPLYAKKTFEAAEEEVRKMRERDAELDLSVKWLYRIDIVTVFD